MKGGGGRGVLCWACAESGGVGSLVARRAMVAAHLAPPAGRTGSPRCTLMVTVLDQSRAGLGSAVIDERNARLAASASAARGYLDGRSLAEVFAWLRPNDLIWNYWVNNYLLGRTPPPFDILSWNADTTRMTAGLHRDFLQLGVSNALTRPGGVDHARLASRPGRHRPRQLPGRRDHRPHLPLAELLPRPPACWAGTSGSCCRPAGTSPRW